MGDNEYAVRQRAQRELARLGFAAFDALTDAEENDDIEIATQARYLARQIRSDWIERQRSAAGSHVLKDYDLQNEADPAGADEAAFELPGDAGMEWLCRLLRFRAVAGAGQASGDADHHPGSPARRRQLAQARGHVAKSSIAAGGRPPVGCETYVEMRTDPQKALASWAELIDAEKKTLEQHPQQSDSRLVMQLLRIEVAQLQALERDDEALAAMHEMVAHRARRAANAWRELVNWLAKRRAWSVIDEVATRFAASFEADPRVALHAGPGAGRRRQERSRPRRRPTALHLNPDRAADHCSLGFVLQHRGLMDWSDREFRHVIDMKSPPLDAQE